MKKAAWGGPFCLSHYRYSRRMLFALTIGAHFAFSSLSAAANSAEVPGEGSAPCASSSLTVSGDLSAALAAALIFCTTSSGVAAGAIRPYQLSDSTLG